MEARKKFANNIRLELSLTNYGFQLKKDNYNREGYDVDEPLKFRAIKELLVRLNVWVETGRFDKGKIDYPEAKRKIVYKLDTSVKSSYVNLMVV